MIKTRLLKSLSLLLCFVLIAAMALFATGCGDNNEVGTNGIEQENAAATIIGEGKTTFSLNVVDGDGNEKLFTVKTDKTTVGEALLELELIAGDVSEYGLYVKTVDGITADYNVDGTYWAFYIGSEYAMTGVDQTDITEGETYSLKVEK